MRSPPLASSVEEILVILDSGSFIAFGDSSIFLFVVLSAKNINGNKLQGRNLQLRSLIASLKTPNLSKDLSSLSRNFKYQEKLKPTEAFYHFKR